MALMVDAMFDIPCGIVPNFLNLTLTPSNQILHPGESCHDFSLCTMFASMGELCYFREMAILIRGYENGSYSVIVADTSG